MGDYIKTQKYDIYTGMSKLGVSAFEKMREENQFMNVKKENLFDLASGE